MSIVFSWLARIALVLLVLLAIVAAVWGFARLTSPTEVQQQALALMQRSSPPEGNNGWTILVSLPAAPVASMPSSADCGEQVDCIAHIEKALEANAATLEAWRPRLDAAARALRAPGFRAPDGLGPADALPPFQPLMQLDGLRALDFALGDPAGALDAACQDAQGAILRATVPDTLIEAMIGIAVFRQHAPLIAEMRQRAPAVPLPDSCMALTLAPDPASEGTLCGAFRGEWHYQKGWMATWAADASAYAEASPDAVGPWWPLSSPLLHDGDWLLARSAERFATACGAEAKDAARADRALVVTAKAPRWVDRVGFAASAILDDFAHAGYADYAERQLDHVARRRLLAAFLQMESMGVALTPAERFVALPEALRGGPRPLRFDATTGRLSVPLRGQIHGEDGGEAVLSVVAPTPAH